MSDPIAPCPFCGNAAASRLDAIADVDAWVYCDNCSACGPMEHTPAEAIAAWNTVSARLAALATAARALVERAEATAQAAHGNPCDFVRGEDLEALKRALEEGRDA